MAQLADVILRDTRANQPNVNTVPVGTLFCVTDEGNIVERNNGNVWQAYSPTDTGITALTGDVTAGPGSGSQAATIPANTITTVKINDKAVTYPKIQDVTATSRVLGRKTAGAGVTEELTFSEVLDFVSSATWGDILFRGTSAWQRLPAGTAGQVLQTNGAGADPSWVTAGGGAAGFNRVIKSADEIVNNSNVVQDDDELFFSVQANKIYVVQGIILLQATGVTSDWRFIWSLPAGGTFFWDPEWIASVARWNPVAVASSPQAIDTGLLTLGSQNNIHGFNFLAILIMAGTAGTANLQWAQNTATVADNTVKAGSSILVIHNE
jgi:hypothetical protein